MKKNVMSNKEFRTNGVTLSDVTKTENAEWGMGNEK